MSFANKCHSGKRFLCLIGTHPTVDKEDKGREITSRGSGKYIVTDFIRPTRDKTPPKIQGFGFFLGTEMNARPPRRHKLCGLFGKFK